MNPPIQTFNKDSFTMAFDCYLDGTYRSTTVPRVLVYFGNSPVNVSQNSDLREYISNTEEETPNLFRVGTSDLLTKFQQTHFIVYLDPVKNDMKIGVFTKDINDTTRKYVEIGSVLQNIPIKQSFQIIIVLGRTFLEVYKDKRLVNTHTIGSLSPNRTLLNTAAIPSNFGLYTPLSFIGNSIKIGHIQIYNGKLTTGIS